jgi:hypothetical protein
MFTWFESRLAAVSNPPSRAIIGDTDERQMSTDNTFDLSSILIFPFEARIRS